MKWKIYAAVLVSVLAFAGVAEAQQLKVATGGTTGTYSKMLKEITGQCSETGIAIIEQNTSGSMENVNLLAGNQVNGAFVQTDVLFYRGRTEDLGNIKTLLALHPEEVHVVAKSVSGIKEGGKFGTNIGAKEVVLSTVSDLAGRSVAAWGGSVITAQVIRLQSELAFNVVEVKGPKEAMAALDSGAVQAIVAVGGSPLGFVEGLDANYKLLQFPESVQSKLKGVYRPARLNYRKMGTAGMGVNTVATDAIFVTREYKTDKFVNSLGALRGCVLSKLDELKETTGTHPKWQAVDASNKGKWAWYDLPTKNVAVKGKK
jgi:TRAP-type uncharacterized transport system substrate-binding protein